MLGVKKKFAKRMYRGGFLELRCLHWGVSANWRNSYHILGKFCNAIDFYVDMDSQWTPTHPHDPPPQNPPSFSFRCYEILSAFRVRTSFFLRDLLCTFYVTQGRPRTWWYVEWLGLVDFLLAIFLSICTSVSCKNLIHTLQSIIYHHHHLPSTAW